MSTLTDKLPKLPEIKLPEIKGLDLDEARKPVHAAVGVVDLYVEQVKDLPAQAKKVQAELTAKFEAAKVERTAQVKAFPADAKKLQVELTEKVSKAQADVTAYYAKLAVRGEKLIGQIRRQPATEAAIAEGKAAVKKAEAATTSAKKSVKSTEKAVEGAATKIG
ncbi:MAG: hypothetical protein JWO12_1799 [Frankiales bacterium]|nr:hypothetical protein [Frankiales bacterium]